MAGCHRIVAEVTNGGLVAKSQAIYVKAVAPVSPNTANVNMWNPSGCPESDQSRSYGEKLPAGNFYVDGKIYSTQANITKVALYVDQVLKHNADCANGDFSCDLMTYTYHSPAIPISTSGSPHRVVVQVLSGSTVIGEVVRYVSAVTLPTPGYFNSFNANGGTFDHIDEVNLTHWKDCENTCVPNNRPEIATTVNLDGQGIKFTSNGVSGVRGPVVFPLGLLFFAQPTAEQQRSRALRSLRVCGPNFQHSGAGAGVSSRAAKVEHVDQELRLAGPLPGSGLLENVRLHRPIQQPGAVLAGVRDPLHGDGARLLVSVHLRFSHRC